MYYSYVEIEYVATSFSPARTDLAVKLLITLQIFVRLLRLIDQNVANVFNLTSSVRVSIVTCCTKDVSTGSPAGLEI